MASVRKDLGRRKIAVPKGAKPESFEPNSVSLLSDGDILSDVTEWISTGFPGLDHILGGGWAVGRCSEVFGPEGHGKTALGHRAMKSCQDMGGHAGILDFEVALDKPKMRQLEIDPKRLFYFAPKDMEQGWDMLWSALDYTEKNRPKYPTMYVFDSVAAAVPRAERLEESMDKVHVGLQARIMGKGCRKLFRRIARVRAHVMFINQERDRVGGSMYQEAVTPGGRAVKFAASMRVRVTRVSTLSRTVKDEKIATGYLIRAATRKCRLFPPHRKTTWVLDFKHGPSPELTLLQNLIDARILKVSGGGMYKAPWSKKPVKKARWIERMEDEGFRSRAEDAYKVFIQKELLDDEGAGPVEDEDEGE